MVWPFSKKKEQPSLDRLLAVADEVEAWVARTWPNFFHEKKEAGLPLFDLMTAFMVTRRRELETAFPALGVAPDEVLFKLVVFGVAASGTHRKSEIVREVGFDVP